MRRGIDLQGFGLVDRSAVHVLLIGGFRSTSVSGKREDLVLLLKGGDLTGTELTEHTDDTPESNGLCMWARFANLFLIAPEAMAGPDVFAALHAALADDARVKSIDEFPDLMPDSPNAWPVGDVFDWEQAQNDNALTDQPRRGRKIAPIRIEVDVPTRTQRSIQGAEAPAERYSAVWDGVALIVGWEESSHCSEMTPSGGHAALSVFEDAAETAGFDTYVQACTPMCEYQFSHTTLVVHVEPDVPSGVEFSEFVHSGSHVHVRAQSFGEDEDTIERHIYALSGDLRRAFVSFGEVRNRGWRLYQVEHQANRAAERLLKLQFDRASLQAGDWKKRLRAVRDTPSYRRKTRQHIAELWLYVASIEDLKSGWRSGVSEFEAEVTRLGCPSLFESDDEPGRESLTSLSTETLQKHAEQAAGRLDNGDLVLVTAVAAAAGSVAAIIVGLIG